MCLIWEFDAILAFGIEEQDDSCPDLLCNSKAALANQPCAVVFSWVEAQVREKDVDDFHALLSAKVSLAPRSTDPGGCCTCSKSPPVVLQTSWALRPEDEDLTPLMLALPLHRSILDEITGLSFPWPCVFKVLCIGISFSLLLTGTSSLQ